MTSSEVYDAISLFAYLNAYEAFKNTQCKIDLTDDDEIMFVCPALMSEWVQMTLRKCLSDAIKLFKYDSKISAVVHFDKNKS